MTEPNPDIDRAARRFSRVTASALLYAMAEADMSIDQIAAKLDTDPGTIRYRIFKLMRGDGDVGVREIAEMFHTTGHRTIFRVEKREDISPEPASSDPETTS